MKHRSILGFALLSLSVAAVACGGGDDKKAKTPESSAGITETSAKEDMPPAPSEAPAAKTTGPAAAAPTGGPAGGMLKVVAIKFTPTAAPAAAGKKKPVISTVGGTVPKEVELKADGTVVVDGKPAAKVKGDQVDSMEGTSMLTVGVDGSLVGNGVKPGFKFDGDDLAGENGLKLSVGDDGAITASKDGKSEVIGKSDNGATSKRATLVIAVLWMNVPSNLGDAKPAAGDKKPGTKTATPAAKK